MITEARLDEGTRAFIWPLLQIDREALREGYEHLSPESRNHRFLAGVPHLTDSMLDHLVDEVDGVDHVALAFVVLDEDNRGTPVGVARMIRYQDRPTDADLAVTVTDTWQGRGVATALLAELVRQRPVGVDRIVTTVAADNAASLAMLCRLGRSTATPAGPHRLDVLVDLAPSNPTSTHHDGAVMTNKQLGTSHALLPNQATSVARMLYNRVAASPDTEAYRFPTPEGWGSTTWAETKATVDVLAAGLLALGIAPEDRVAIASSTRIDWIYADLAITCAGAATTTIYPTTNVDDVALIVADSGTRIVFAEDDAQVAKLRGLRDELPDLVRVITFDGTADGEWVLSLEDLRDLGAEHLAARPTAVEEVVDAIRPEHLATLIYTSGTTGRPKGVELPHACWTYLGAVAEDLRFLSLQDLQYLWLPLAHSFGKMLESVQLQVGFPTVVDGRMDHIVSNLVEVRPTFMAGPPRIFEKVHAKIVQTVEEDGGLRGVLFGWAFRVGERVARAELEGQRPGRFTLAQHVLADRLVLAKVRARLGGRIRFLISGSAALSPEVGAWFRAAGMVVLEGYGLTETSAGACLVRLENPVLGRVGPPVPGTEVRIAADGEILVRGPSVMRGYHGLPEATDEVLDADGWLSTGDVGDLDDRGNLRITDRKKDLIKTSGGKYIAPQAIEVMFKADCPLASQMVVHAEGRSHATALVTVDPDAVAQWAEARGMTGTDYARLTADPDLRAYVNRSIDLVNSKVNRWETIKDFRILDRDLTVEDGEVTPSMKVRRKVVESRYRSLLDSMY